MWVLERPEVSRRRQVDGVNRISTDRCGYLKEKKTSREKSKCNRQMELTGNWARIRTGGQTG